MSSRILAGRYELLERIGDGGMAVVYKARCRLLNRFVAIKILKPEFTKDVKFIENFRRESQAAASLSHPNIVNIYDVGREGNIHYIVMELIEGQVLSNVIKNEGPLEWRRAVEITKQIASALSLAHKNHIIHRDVKPHNILMTEDGVAKITDFGIAKAINSSTIGESTGTIMGSVHYFSPEQARGVYVDEKSDIYSLGIVLYEMLTGRVPFDGENPVAVALMHINSEMELPSNLVEGIPPGLENVVMKATNKCQVSRYASADEMLEALNNLTFVTNIVGDSVFAGVRNVKHGNVVSTASVKDAEGNKEEQVKEKHGKTSKKKFKINKIKVIAAILALLCAIPISHFIVNTINSIGESEDIKVPDLRGMTFAQGEQVALDNKLKLEKGDTVYSSDYEEGMIVSQTPNENAAVKKGKTITVNISKGAKQGTVPNIVSKSYDDAVFFLEKYGYKEGKVDSQPSDMPKDTVISQQPEAGDEANPGTAINFVVSEGKPEGEVKMPQLIGKDIDVAKLEIEKAGLKLGDPVYEKSDVYDKNQVMWQQYEAGSVLAADTTVNLKISTADESAGSKAIALDIDYSYAKTPVFYITVIISDEEGTRKVLAGEQRLKDDGGDVLSLTGTGKGTVTVLFDNEEIMKKNVDFSTGAIN